jgi:hypothetical protein
MDLSRHGKLISVTDFICNFSYFSHLVIYHCLCIGLGNSKNLLMHTGGVFPFKKLGHKNAIKPGYLTTLSTPSKEVAKKPQGVSTTVHL